jgi:hypothetical protein
MNEARHRQELELEALPAVPLPSSEPDEPENKFFASIAENTTDFCDATGFTPMVTLLLA